MLTEIKIESGIEITNEEIKSLIWNIDSACNLRKPHLQIAAQEAIKNPKWKLISPALKNCRIQIMKNLELI